MLEPQTLASLRLVLGQGMAAGRSVGMGPEARRLARIVDAQVIGDEVLVLLAHARARHVFGIPTPMEHLTESPWTGIPVQNLGDWVEELWLRLSEEIDTGFVANASRRDAGEYIELRAPLWPADDRFYVSVSEPGEAPLVAGEVIAYVTAWSNSSTGCPKVGQAAVSWSEIGSEPVALVNEIDIGPGVSRSVVWDLLHRAIHVGADAGAVSIETDAAVEHLEVLGFQQGGRGFIVDAALTAEDPQAVVALPECKHRRTR